MGNLIASENMADVATVGRRVQRCYDRLDQLVLEAQLRPNDSLDCTDMAALPAEAPRTAYRYDILGRMDCQVKNDVATVYRYDIQGQLALVSHGIDGGIEACDSIELGQATRYLYDDFGQIIVRTSPDSGTTQFVYDTAGRLVKTLDANETITTNTYDERGRLISVGYTDKLGVDLGGSYELFYDWINPTMTSALPGSTCGKLRFDPREAMLAGRLAWVRHNAGATFYSYNEFGETTAVYEQLGDTFEPCALRVTRYAYDGAGRMEKVEYPTGTTVEYIREGIYISGVKVLNRFNELLMEYAVTSHDAGGQALAYTVFAPGPGGDITFSASFDLAGRPIARSYLDGNGAQVDYSILARTPLGQAQVVAVGRSTVDTVSYAYDANGRVTASTSSIGVGFDDCTYSYDDPEISDESGNRVRMTCTKGGVDSVVDYGYEVGSNRLESMTWANGVCGGEVVAVDLDAAGVGAYSIPPRWRRLIPPASIGEISHFTHRWNKSVG